MIIYLLLNTVNLKAYIGQHKGDKISGRWNDDLSGGHNRHLESARMKYGAKVFTRTVLHHAKNQHELDRMETFFIILYQSFNPEFGYNMTIGGEGGRLTEEGRHNLSKAKLGRKTGMKRARFRICYICFSAFNLGWNTETVFCSRNCYKLHRSLYLKGKAVPQFDCYHKEAVGKPSWNSGKTFAELFGKQAKEIAWKCGSASRGKVFTDTHCENISKAIVGREFSAAHITNIKAAWANDNRRENAKQRQLRKHPSKESIEANKIANQLYYASLSPEQKTERIRKIKEGKLRAKLQRLQEVA